MIIPLNKPFLHVVIPPCEVMLTSYEEADGNVHAAHKLHFTIKGYKNQYMVFGGKGFVTCKLWYCMIDLIYQEGGFASG